MSNPVKAIARRLRHQCQSHAEVTLDHWESEDWHSLLFDGGRHRIHLCLNGEDIDGAIDRMRADIEAQDFTIPGHLIADIRIAAADPQDDGRMVRLEATTIAADHAISV